MKTLHRISMFLVLFAAFACVLQAQNQRMIILADMGNEPDEEQQMVHMLACANEFDLEGLIAVTGKFLNPNSNNPEKQRLYPELFFELIKGYERVYENLQKHASGYPEPEYLKSIVAEGQKGYGIEGVGEGKSSPGSEIIIKSLEKNDSRPLYIVVNAGSNTLAQALYELKQKSNEVSMAGYINKIRVFENGAQDNAGAWICSEFPEIHWIRSNYQTYCYAGPSVDGGFNNKGDSKELGPWVWKPFAYSGTGQHQWALEHIKGGHGGLGYYWPVRQFKGGGISFLEGGGTIPFLALVNKGLYDINNPWWGGWSGLYTRNKVENYWSKHQSVKKDEDTYAPFYMFGEQTETWYDTTRKIQYENSIYAPVFRWRAAFFNDFVCRMDWCKKSYDQANHHPIAAVNGDTNHSIILIKAKPGEQLSFDASASSDPDGDELVKNWWIYNEAGISSEDIVLEQLSIDRVSIKIPKGKIKREVHLILEVIDQNKIAKLSDYRRIVINVN